MSHSAMTRAALLAIAILAVGALPVEAHWPDRLEIRRAREWVRDRTTERGWRCADTLWDRESHWSERSGKPWRAYGIPQAFPGYRMESAERPWRGRLWDSWREDALVQVAWGLAYVRGRYGSFCAARRFQSAHGWY